MMDSKIAELIARKIFECGDEPDSPCHRIQFKGGDWQGIETDQGGFCETALANFLEDIDINNHRGSDEY